MAGKRRYHAALAVATESGEAEPLPCAIMAPGDDAAALEASLIENIARFNHAPIEVGQIISAHADAESPFNRDGKVFH